MKVKISKEETSENSLWDIFLINDWRGRFSPMQGNATLGQEGLEHIRKVAE